jgi:hypothetical protein
VERIHKDGSASLKRWLTSELGSALEALAGPEPFYAVTPHYVVEDQVKNFHHVECCTGILSPAGPRVLRASGKFVARVDSHGPLNSPWGLAIAPSEFGKFAGDLLVGNFGDGTINAFDLKHHDQFADKLTGVDGKPITIGDLWALTRATAARRDHGRDLLHLRRSG